MKEGTTLIYHSEGLLPKLIRFFTKSKYNHIGLVGERVDNGWVVYEAQAEGFIKTVYEDWYMNKRIADGTIVPKDFKSKLYKVAPEAEKLLGRPYGVSTLFRIVWAIITGKEKKSWSDGDKSVICSEAISILLYVCSNKKIDLPTEFNCTHDYITPDNIFQSSQ